MHCSNCDKQIQNPDQRYYNCCGIKLPFRTPQGFSSKLNYPLEIPIVQSSNREYQPRSVYTGEPIT